MAALILYKLLGSIMPASLNYYEAAMSNHSRPVYSTVTGRLCPDCKQARSNCQCKTLQQQQVKGDGIVRIHRETKGRAGKGVTLIKGLPLNEVDLKAITTKMKQHCGTGGTLKDGVIEIQGDNRDKLLAWLVVQGYKAKLAGG
jgi:translation initiation factor 1